jgi:phospholipid transport system substrate-binding protein
MTFRGIFASVALASCIAFSGTYSSSASADGNADAQKFVQQEHVDIANIMRAKGNDAQINAVLDKFVDYDELARRSFGQPCPPAVGGCTNHWNELNEGQKNEVKGLLRQLVQKNYRKQLVKTLDYDIEYQDARTNQLGDAKVRTQAKSKAKPRDPAIQVDYLVRGTGGAYKVVDIVTEGSSLTKNYYDQFHKMLTTQGEGYPHVVKKLNDKIAKKD